MTKSIDKSLYVMTETVLSETTVEDNDVHALYIDIEPYDQFGIQANWGSGTDTVTLKVYGTVEIVGATDLMLTRDFKDVTIKLLNVLGTQAATYTADVMLMSPLPFPMTALKITYQRTVGSADDQTLEIFIKKY